MNEHMLFALIATGDPGAFRELYEHYRGRVYGAALKWTRSPEAAEEITQEVFIQLWISRHRLPEVREPKAYLFTTAYHRISGHLRQEKNRRRILSAACAAIPVVSDVTEETIAYRDRCRWLDAAVDQLSPQKKTIYLLSRHQGQSNQEIGLRLNLSPNTVKSHLHQALRFLRRFVQHTAVLAGMMVHFLQR